MAFGNEIKKPRLIPTIEVCLRDETGIEYSLHKFSAGNGDDAISGQYAQAKHHAEKELTKLREQGIDGQSDVYLRTNSEVMKNMFPDDHKLVYS